MEDELDKQETLGLRNFTRRTPTVTILNVAPSGTTLDQRVGRLLENYSKEAASHP